MKVFRQKVKKINRWSYWGDFGEIGIGVSMGRIETNNPWRPDLLHYHKSGIIYILCLEGKGIIEVNGKKVTLHKDELLQIDPQEKYRHLTAIQVPFWWITICTSKNPRDKVVVKD